jgi:hypothetical protein
MQKLNQGKKTGHQKHQLAYQEHSCTAPTGEMGRRRRDGTHLPQKIIQYRVKWRMQKMDTQFLNSIKQ